MNLIASPSYFSLIFLSLVCLSHQILSPSAHAEDSLWTQFLGSDGRGVSKSVVPTRWSQELNIDWRTELPGRGWSSPVVSNEKVYLTAAIPLSNGSSDTQEDGELESREDTEFELSLLIVDLETGDLMKRVPIMIQDDKRPSRMHGKNSHASPTPIIRDDRILVHFGYQGTACLSLDGEIIWVNRELYFPPTHGNGGSPVLVGDHLVFTCDGGKEPKVVALNSRTGEVAWSVLRTVDAIKPFSFCTPAVIPVKDKRLVIAPGSDGVLAINSEDGRVEWSFGYIGYSVVPKPVLVDGVLVISTGFDQARMLAIDPTGVGDITETNLLWEVDRNVPKTPSMIADKGLIYSVSDDGIALCIEAATGEIVYRERLGGSYSASPILAGGHLYFTSESGKTTVVKQGKTFEVIAENELEERTLSTMAILTDTLLMRTDKAIYRITNSN
ncbi:MAG: PQQ-binding-like beta-propeller repeat protein [Planctomycetota bacterium]|nr:PQQ-binding-like beta-propeller repeat protein [Planctomycetota bacterium]